jgi:hypothetical protein
MEGQNGRDHQWRECFDWALDTRSTRASRAPIASHRWEVALTSNRVDGTRKRTDLNLFTGSGGDPFFGLFPFLVEKEKATLSTTFDKLIRLCDELGCKDPRR